MSPGTFLKFLTFKANFSLAFDIFVRRSFNLLNHLQFKASQATASLKKCPPAVCGPVDPGRAIGNIALFALVW